jgi:hypothetical protein
MPSKFKGLKVLVCMSVLLFMFSTMIFSAGAETSDSRATGTMDVPTWNVDDEWGYKIPQYAYSSYYYGVGMKVVGTETIDGAECYDIKIWWDGDYGADGGSEIDYQVPGLTYQSQYIGHAYLTKDKLAIAKFENDLKAVMKFDGSQIMSYYNTRQGDFDYTQYLDKMVNWKYDISYSFKITYVYDPPFVMYDFPLEVNKTWSSTSNVTITWEYSTNIYMSDQMKRDLEEMGESNFTGIDDVQEEGTDSTQFTLTGSFEVVSEDSVDTDTGTHSVFEVAYDISSYYTRAAGEPPPEYYGDISLPGGDATLELVGGSEGSGTVYLNSESGRPEMVESGTYYTTTYSSVEPSSVTNSYDDEISKSSSSDGAGSDSSGFGDNSTILLIIAGIIGTVVVLVLAIVVIIVKKINAGQDQQYSQYPPPMAHQEHVPEPEQESEVEWEEGPEQPQDYADRVPEPERGPEPAPTPAPEPAPPAQPQPPQ